MIRSPLFIGLKPMLATMIAFRWGEAYFFQMAEVWWFLHQEHLVLPPAKACWAVIIYENTS
jgi:hypothetical protein